jgi:hypothetical protein
MGLTSLQKNLGYNSYILKDMKGTTLMLSVNGKHLNQKTS